ncbi:hypothetical protein DXG01_015676, partial [Tephrocybe rancida]
MCLARGLFPSKCLTMILADDGQTSSNGLSLSSAGYIYDDFVVADSFDEADHSDASNAARHALNDAPARTRRIAQKMAIKDEASEGEVPLPLHDVPQADAN